MTYMNSTNNDNCTFCEKINIEFLTRACFWLKYFKIRPWMSKIPIFWQLAIVPFQKILKFSLNSIFLRQRQFLVLLILYLRTWNSITGIAILLTLQKLWHDDYCTSFDFCQQFWQISSRECCVHIRLWLNMVVRVVEFSREGCKNRKIFA